MPYDVGRDPYINKSTGVLRNLLGMTTQKELDKAEADITTVHISTLIVEDKPELEEFNWEFLCRLHEDIFREIYDWAGQPRTIELSKDETSFARAEYITASAVQLFKELDEDNYLDRLVLNEFVSKLAYYYSELNILHPFREGNGRAIRTFLTMLAENLDWNIIWDEMSPEDNIRACIAGYMGDEKPLRNMLNKIVKPIDRF